MLCPRIDLGVVPGGVAVGGQKVPVKSAASAGAMPNIRRQVGRSAGSSCLKMSHASLKCWKWGHL